MNALFLCAAVGIFAVAGTGTARVQELLRESVVGKSSGNLSISETLFKAWYKIRPQADVGFAPGLVSQQCLQCICEKESNCRPIGCHPDRGSDSCGYFQIKENYWIDCGSLGKSWEECANDIYCSSSCVQAYMKRYTKWAGCPEDCESFAREHNGGPKGCKKTTTLPYWNSLKKIKGCENVHL